MSTPRLAPRLLAQQPSSGPQTPAPERRQSRVSAQTSRKVLEFVRQPVPEMAAIVVPPFFLVTYARSILTPQQLRYARERENQTRTFGEIR